MSKVTRALMPTEPKQTATIHVLFNKCDEIFEKHRQENPDLYDTIKQNKKIALLSFSAVADGTAVKKSSHKKKPETILNQPLRGALLRGVISQNQAAIKSSIAELNHIAHPRTATSNQKCPYQTIDEERTYRASVLSLIRHLIRHKKFKKLLIQDHLPASIDGTQKFYRQGLLQDDCWYERCVGLPENDDHQQSLAIAGLVPSTEFRKVAFILSNGIMLPY